MSAVAKYIGKHIENVPRKEVEDSAGVFGFTAEQARSLRGVLRFLNDKDRDILYLMFVSKKKQRDVLHILDRTQQLLAYDVRRIRRRLKFILYLHSVFDIFMGFVRSNSGGFTPEEMEILTLMFYTSSFTLTSEVMSISQVRVRYAYNRCLRRMEEREMWDAYEIFMVIRSNLNIIRRVYRGAEANPGGLSVVV